MIDLSRLDLSNLSPQKQAALQILAPYLIQHNPSFSEWAESNFYITASPPKPINLIPWQKLLFDWPLIPSNKINTILISQPKKSGKTAIASAIGRYKAETCGPLGTVYAIANDLRQAKSRLYTGVTDSIELDPTYDRSQKGIPNRWHILNTEATFLPTNSTLTAIPLDYKGEAGANQDCSLWTEFWGFMGELAKRMWVEFTPPPTKFSQRIVEGYAGYRGESVIWQELWDIARDGKQLTIDDVPEWANYFPEEEQLPVWINKDAGFYAILDQGPTSRRMPWQTPSYYKEQAIALDPPDFDRFHNNFWIDPISDFLPDAWVRSCIDNELPPPLAPFVPNQVNTIEVPREELSKYVVSLQRPPTVRPTRTIVLGADASVTGDATAIIGVSRHSSFNDHIVVEFCNLWKPSRSEPLDYTTTIESAIRFYSKYYNVVCVAYDPYQLHNLMTNLNNEYVVWCDPFPQMNKRLEADKQLFDLFKDRRIHFRGEQPIIESIGMCGARKQPNDNSKLRIVKKTNESIIDPTVALSMAAYQCLFLNL